MLLGPNGAGKTTALLMLTTVIKPTEGTATVGGNDVRKSPDKARQFIGIFARARYAYLLILFIIYALKTPRLMKVC